MVEPPIVQHRNAVKTHCPAGHEYDFVDAAGRRRCRACCRAADAKRRAKRTHSTARVQLYQLELGDCLACGTFGWLYAPADRVLMAMCGKCCTRLWG